MVCTLALVMAGCSASSSGPGDADDTDAFSDDDASGDSEVIAPPTIASFAASSATLGLGGGEVQLSWQQTGAVELAIDGGIGSVTGLTSVNVAIAATTTFTLVATNGAGSTQAQVTVQVEVPTAPPVIHSFAGTPSQLPAAGGTTTLQWSVDSAATLSIASATGGTIVVTGSSQHDVSLSATTTYTLAASNALGTTTAETTVQVYVPTGPPSVMSFIGTPANLPVGGGHVTLSWATVDAQTLVIDNGVGSVLGRTSIDVPISATTAFKLTAGNLHGSAQQVALVQVAAQAAPTITSFTASPTSRVGAGYVELSWVTQDADTLYLDGVGFVTFEPLPLSVWVSTTTTFLLRAHNATSNAQASVTVFVTP